MTQMQPRRTVRLNAAREEDVAEAAALLCAGRLVAFATETVYGLGANALDAAAVESIFAAKARPAWDPLIVHLPGGDTDQLARVAVVEGASIERVQRLQQAFWPGPLTLLLPRAAAIGAVVTAGRPLVGLRVPALQSARDLLRLAGVPVAAPSANRFGHTSPTTAAHVLADLDGRIDAVLDGGACTIGLESTVFDPAACIVYRAGGVDAAALAEVLGADVRVYEERAGATAPQSLPSPGVGIRHYAPAVPLRLCDGTPQALEAAVAEARRQGLRVAVMLPVGWHAAGAAATWPWGHWDDAASLARALYAGLRSLEREPADVIVCPEPTAAAFGAALRDRLRKAARPG